jgi:hypothetical protein
MPLAGSLGGSATKSKLLQLRYEGWEGEAIASYAGCWVAVPSDHPTRATGQWRMFVGRLLRKGLLAHATKGSRPAIPFIESSFRSHCLCPASASMLR